MKKLVVFFSTLVFMTMMCAANAAEMKVGLVDIQAVLQKSQTVAKMRSSLQNQFAPQEKAFAAKQKTLQNDVATYKRDNAIMKDSDRSALEKKISMEQQALNKDQAAFQNQVSAAQNKDMQIIMNKVQQAVANIAKKRGLNMVVAKATTLYADGSVVDITDAVLKAIG